MDALTFGLLLFTIILALVAVFWSDRDQRRIMTLEAQTDILAGAIHDLVNNAKINDARQQAMEDWLKADESSAFMDALILHTEANDVAR
jgi:hypothetical protein